MRVIGRKLVPPPPSPPQPKNPFMEAPFTVKSHYYTTGSNSTSSIQNSAAVTSNGGGDSSKTPTLFDQDYFNVPTNTSLNEIKTITSGEFKTDNNPKYATKSNAGDDGSGGGISNMSFDE